MSLVLSAITVGSSVSAVVCHTRAFPFVGYEGTSVVMVSNSSRARIFYQTVTCRKFVGREMYFYSFSVLTQVFALL